jgi:hypothetical protein
MANFQKYLADCDVPSDEILEDWRWLVGSKRQLWCITKAGDAILRESGNAGIYFLDTVAGRLIRIADNEQQFALAVAKPENAEQWLMHEMVDGEATLGVVPGQNQCLTFMQPPVLGGQIDPVNIEACDVRVHFSIAGQIHQQVKDLPAGTKIGKIEIESDKQPNKPWWKFW